MKKILSFLYIIAIALITFFLVPIYKTKGSLNFLKDYKSLFENSQLDLMSGTTLAFRNNGTSSYIKKEPIFSDKYLLESNGDTINKFNLSFYSVPETKKNNLSSGMYVIIDDLYLDDKGNNLKLDDEGKYLIYFQMFFNNPLEINGKLINDSKDVFIPLYDGKSGVLYFDQSFLKNEGGYIEIDKILISALKEDDNSVNLLTLTRSSYIGKIESDVFDDVNRDISNITSDNINLLNSFDVNDLKSNDKIYYNEELVKVFKSKYNYFFYFIIIWFIIVSVITYFLFAHKYVKILLQNKRAQKKIEIEKMKEVIKMEEIK